MTSKLLLLLYACMFFLCNTSAQPKKEISKGTLFIIGGGNKSPELVKQLISTAHLSSTDYIVILPMSSAEPDSSYYFIKEDLTPSTNNTIANLNFTKDKLANTIWLDSLKHAKLIYITGGDQALFMKAVLQTPVYEAIHYAFNHGATIAGTSAGAAVMNKYMITGNQLLDTVYSSTFDRLRKNNIEIAEGLSLVTGAIIDQHFITRSRYNRLLTALALYPKLPCIGIDEGTALIIQGKHITVAGDSQVILFTEPLGLQITGNGLIKFNSITLKIYTKGDAFFLK